MKNNKKDVFLVISIFSFLIIFSVVAWFKPVDDYSFAERRPLKASPEINIQNIFNGNFSKEFEEYSLDQFPSRDNFRKIKALTEFNFFGKKTNNDIYCKNGYLSKIEYPVDFNSLKNANKKICAIYEKLLTEKNINAYISVVPDKNYYLINSEDGYLKLNYDEFIAEFKNTNKYILNGEIKYIDIFDLLSIDDYYKTDSHWRQENIIPVAKRISEKMGVELKAIYDIKTLENEFYGVYSGQLGLDTEADKIKYLDNENLSNITVFNYETQKEMSVYDMEKAFGKDPYEMFLSGAVSLIEMKNPLATTDKELIVFRDSFGSSLAPLFTEGYKTVTLVDTRYIHPNMLTKFIDFNNQDVLFIYSTSVLNNSETLK